MSRALPEPLTLANMKMGGRYNWKNQPERLVYIGRNWSGNGWWHQFEKVDERGIVWCEVLDADLHMLEETEDAALATLQGLSPAQATPEPTYTGNLRDPDTWATYIAGVIDSYLSSENAVRERDVREAALAGIIRRRLGWLTAPEHVPDPGCKSCHGTGSVCVGHSGREDDGNAPVASIRLSQQDLANILAVAYDEGARAVIAKLESA